MIDAFSSAPNTTVLEGALARLRPTRVEDAENYVRWLTDPEIDPEAARTPVTVEGERRWIEEHLAKPDLVSFEIETLDGKHIGTTTLHGINMEDRYASLGIEIGEKQHWGKGYGEEATRLLLEHGFSHLRLHRIQLEVNAFNARAIRLYEKVGFFLEGTHREKIFLNGTFHDEHVMSMLAEEWERRR